LGLFIRIIITLRGYGSHIQSEIPRHDRNDYINDNIKDQKKYGAK